MSGGSQHNPNGRQAQLGAGWSPLQVANFLARAPQAHLAPERGVTWHTPTPPPHLYHVPAPSPPDPLQGLLQLQAMKASGNALFRHTATPPELYRHTPTPPDKHLMRHTPSPGDVKAGAALPPAELYPHLGPGRGEKLPRSEESFPRGVDLSTGTRGSNGALPPLPQHPPHPPHPASPALSVRDAPTINSLIARAQPRPGHARVDALLERLSSPASPHSVIVHSRQPHTPSPPDSNEDSADSCGAPPGSKRKRKPERTVRLSTVPPPPAPTQPTLENGDAHTQNGPEENETKERTEPAKEATPPRTEPVAAVEAAPPTTQAPPPDQSRVEPAPPSPEPHARRKTRTNSSETIDEIAAMIAADPAPAPPAIETKQDTPVVTIDKLESVLASPDPKKEEDPAKLEEPPALAPRRPGRAAGNAALHEPSEARPADTATAEPTTASGSTFVEVENQLEKMFAGLEEEPSQSKTDDNPKPKKRRKSAPTKGETKPGRRTNRALTGDGRRKGGKKKAAGKVKKTKEVKDAYDSGSNASSSRSRGPYIQIRGPRDSPLSVSVINAATGEDDSDVTTRRKPNADEFRNGLRARGLHASTLGLRYDATTPDATWLCVFCQRGPHAAGLGDLFGPYTVDTDCEEYLALDEATRRRWPCGEVWFHAWCAVWAPGVLAAGARLHGLRAAVWGAAAARCSHCQQRGANIVCHRRGCSATAHLPCAMSRHWKLDDDEFKALCPTHAQ